jgi:chromate reductase, NAD(P)H dehydrogenase (quinone)
VWAQAELRKVLAATGARVVDAEVALGHADSRFDQDGRLVDEALRQELAETVDALMDAVGARPLAAAAAA